MTKAEAIFVLEHIEAHNGLAKEAKLMAIKALKKPEIIRCKDCIYWDKEIPISTVTPEYYKCLRIPYHANTANGYCDQAERKEKIDDQT